MMPDTGQSMSDHGGVRQPPREMDGPHTERGHLHVLLGAAPGVGKTYSMLAEGHRKRELDVDVVIGYVDCHERPGTLAMLDRLETVPEKTVSYQDTTFSEMDTDAVIARAPRLALVDELAHTNVPGSPRPKRWQDIDALLEAGIDVVTTVNIQHLESLVDVVEEITGVLPRETVPDEVVRRADEIELVDLTPESLRRRIIDGRIFLPSDVAPALATYFRVGNLTALRELAMIWLADEVEEQLERYRAEHGITETWQARERVVVGLTGGREGAALVRRAARIADRVAGADLCAVHIASREALTGAHPAGLNEQHELVESLGGTFHEVAADDVPTALLTFARAMDASQLVLGATRRGRFSQFFSPSIGARVAARSGNIDVHIVSHPDADRARGRRMPPPATSRRVVGLVLAIVIVPALACGLVLLPVWLPLAEAALLFLVVVVSAAVVGGMWPAVVATALVCAILGYFYAVPLVVVRSGPTRDVLSLTAFVLIGVTVGIAVDRAIRRTRAASRTGAEAAALVALLHAALGGDGAAENILERLRRVSSLDAATLLERIGAPPLAPPGQDRGTTRWRMAATVGETPWVTPDDADMIARVDGSEILAVRGPGAAGLDQQLLEVYARQAAVALHQERLRAEAQMLGPLAEVDWIRTALLDTVGHSLRSPLAALRRQVELLRALHGVHLDPTVGQALDTLSDSVDVMERLEDTVEQMARLQTSVPQVSVRSVALDDVLSQVFDALDEAGSARVQVDIPLGLPPVLVDPGVLEHVLRSALVRALRRTPLGRTVVIDAEAERTTVQVRVVDGGALPPEQLAPEQMHGWPYRQFLDTNDRLDLDLVLCDSLVGVIGGSLQLAAADHNGAAVIITVPAGGTPAEDSA